jgi:hypothetical protein
MDGEFYVATNSYCLLAMRSKTREVSDPKLFIPRTSHFSSLLDKHKQNCGLHLTIRSGEPSLLTLSKQDEDSLCCELPVTDGKGYPDWRKLLHGAIAQALCSLVSPGYNCLDPMLFGKFPSPCNVCFVDKGNAQVVLLWSDNWLGLQMPVWNGRIAEPEDYASVNLGSWRIPQGQLDILKGLCKSMEATASVPQERPDDQHLELVEIF